MDSNKSLDNIIVDLKERAKELRCLYSIQEIFRDMDYGEQIKVNVYAGVDENGDLKIVDRQIAKEGGKRR